MKKLYLLRSGLLLLMVMGASIVQAQNLSNTAAKGLFHPFFFRVGAMSGIMTSRTGDVGTLGLRTEYGLSGKFSIVGDAQLANGNSAISGGQGSIAMRYQPLILGKFQPYASMGFGVGSVSGEGRRHCHHQTVSAAPTAAAPGEVATPPTNAHHLGGIVLFQLGANFRLSSHFIASAEAGFQRHMSRHGDPALIGYRAGLAYQFGR